MPSGFISMRGNPGVKASTMPTIRNTMAGATASFFASVAEAPSTARTSRTVRNVVTMPGSNRAGHDVDHQGQQRGVKYERGYPVGDGRSPDDLVGDADVRDLRRHSDHK